MATNVTNIAASISLFELIESANKKIVIVAPYIKSTILKRINSIIPNSVEEFVCITRWHPNDIASGACDIEIFDDISSIKGGKLFMNQYLHAKFYSNDYSALIGSANLTQRGLGLCIPNNLEILVELSKDIKGIKEWENALLESSVPVTKNLRDKILSESLSIAKNKTFDCVFEVETVVNSVSNSWIPQCNAPDCLWLVYNGRGHDYMLKSSYESAQEDLKTLQIPIGLNKVQFENHIRLAFKHMEIYYQVEHLSKSGLTDETAHQMLMEHIQTNSFDFDPKISWKIIKNWLFHFFPNDYRTGGGEQFLFRGKEFRRT